MSRAYSGIPVEGRKSWVVPRLVKEIFVGFAVVAIAVVAISKGVQHWGGKISRAAGALEADELPPAIAPSFKLPLHDGKMVDVSQYKGKVVLLNFWATWCPPCREAEPSLRKLAASVDPSKFELVAENKLGDEVFATPAICGNHIYMRVVERSGEQRQEMLYCLGMGSNDR